MNSFGRRHRSGLAVIAVMALAHRLRAARLRGDVTVTPDTNLPASANVNVSGNGFAANQPGTLQECKFNTGLGFDECKDIGSFTTNASGNFGPVPVTVTSTYVSSDSTNVDCTTDDQLPRRGDPRQRLRPRGGSDLLRLGRDHHHVDDHAPRRRPPRPRRPPPPRLRPPRPPRLRTTPTTTSSTTTSTHLPTPTTTSSTTTSTTSPTTTSSTSTTAPPTSTTSTTLPTTTSSTTSTNAADHDLVDHHHQHLDHHHTLPTTTSSTTTVHHRADHDLVVVDIHHRRRPRPPRLRTTTTTTTPGPSAGCAALQAARARSMRRSMSSRRPAGTSPSWLETIRAFVNGFYDAALADCGPPSGTTSSTSSTRLHHHLDVHQHFDVHQHLDDDVDVDHHHGAAGTRPLRRAGAGPYGVQCADRRHPGGGGCPTVPGGAEEPGQRPLRRGAGHLRRLRVGAT